MRAIVIAFILISALAACTSEPPQAVKMPTLAVLPSETMIPTNTPTVTATETPTLTLTPSPTATFTHTPTPLATSTPIPTSTPDCPIETWWRDAEVIIQQFLDTAEVASQTSRIALSGVILQMRQFQREFERLDYPECMAEVYSAVRSGMRNTTDGFTSFMGESEILSSIELAFATQYFWNATELLRGKVLFDEYRIFDTAVFIWGGDSPNEATATWLAATSIPTQRPPSTPASSRCSNQDMGVLLNFANSVMPLVEGLTNVQDSAQLSEIRAAIAALPYPNCFVVARGHLLDAFDEMYLALVSSTPTTAQEHVDNAMASMQRFQEESAALGIGGN